ncbi:MAG: tryptophan synthase subunit alpha [Anaerolineae bacterium]|nr:tryptophan synthase subunit alpha [Anaerolineae bacterium]MDW8070678.1 tryptophan synthase subunit alpha [Anaerolineae bacterium]
MGRDRIRAVFRDGHTAFMPYVMLGFPDPDTCRTVIEQLVDVGADLFELGVPFSDPLADGPVIQAAAQRALEHGITLADCIALVAELRAQGFATPAVLMSYVNPILAYGLERFVADSAAAGVDGCIVPDLPPEEAGDLEALCRHYGMALIYLVAPNSPPERIALVAARTQGFLYLVSVTGVTGARDVLPPTLPEFVARVRTATDQPLALGFGIQSGEQARAMRDLVDGVIVGSALVERAGRSLEQMTRLAREIHAALHAPEMGR